MLLCAGEKRFYSSSTIALQALADAHGTKELDVPEGVIERTESIELNTEAKGELRVTVKGASGLKAADRSGFSDPYCKVMLGESKEIESTAQKTKTMKKTLEPTWDETFRFPGTLKALANEQLFLKVYDWDQIGKVPPPRPRRPPALTGGAAMAAEPTSLADDPRVVAGQFNRGPNVWPEGLPGFEPTMAAYFEAMRRLSQRLMKGIALSLDLDEDYFEIFNRDPVATLRLLHYPPQRENAEPNEKGAGAHTDWGALTLLLQDDVGGLQVFDKNTGEWLHAAPVPGTFVVNLGDALAHWTNDLYKSTLHRVVNASGRERYSVPFFYDGDADYEVTCIPTCLKPGEEPKYAPITVEGHLMNMYKKSYG